jgi:hypothetical protein
MSAQPLPDPATRIYLLRVALAYYADEHSAHCTRSLGPCTCNARVAIDALADDAEASQPTTRTPDHA